jgi:ankyrin repeat protein
MAFSDNPLFDQLVDAAVLDQPTAEQLLREHPELIHATNRLGETALHFLAVEDYAEGVAFLARHGAPVNARNDSQRTPLMEAAMVGATEVVRALLASGADPSVQTPDGDTVWDLLDPESRTELLSILHEHGFVPPQRSA